MNRITNWFLRRKGVAPEMTTPTTMPKWAEQVTAAFARCYGWTYKTHVEDGTLTITCDDAAVRITRSGWVVRIGLG